MGDADRLRIGACWVCFSRQLSGPGTESDPAWCAAVIMAAARVVAELSLRGTATAPYVPGLLALRVGPLMEQTLDGLPGRPDVLLVDATGRDHPRRSGLALQLGAELDLPTVGVTHRPLVASGAWPADRAGATSPVRIDGVEVGCWLRTRPGLRPLVVHPGWRTDLDTAVRLVTAVTRDHRTPQPLRRARQLARQARDRERRR